jgi:hypothetical protein
MPATLNTVELNVSFSKNFSLQLKFQQSFIYASFQLAVGAQKNTETSSVNLERWELKQLSDFPTASTK